MGYLNLPRQLRTALDPWRTVNERAWALSSCFSALASTARYVVGPGDLVERFARRFGTRRDKHGRITTRIEETAALLSATRRALQAHQRAYDHRRRAAKRSPRRTPAPPPFTREAVLALVEGVLERSRHAADPPRPDGRRALDVAIDDLARVARTAGDAKAVRLLAEILDAARTDGWWDALREALDVAYPEGEFPLRPPLEGPAQRAERFAVRTRYAAGVWDALSARGWMSSSA